MTMPVSIPILFAHILAAASASSLVHTFQTRVELEIVLRLAFRIDSPCTVVMARLAVTHVFPH